MSHPRVKHRPVVHKSTAGILQSIPEAVDLVGNPQGLTNNTVALPLFCAGDQRGGAGCDLSTAC
jgi:hypothetical protein